MIIKHNYDGTNKNQTTQSEITVPYLQTNEMPTILGAGAKILSISTKKELKKNCKH